MIRKTRSEVIAIANELTKTRVAERQAQRPDRELREWDLIDIALGAAYDTIHDANYGDGNFPDADDRESGGENATRAA